MEIVKISESGPSLYCFFSGQKGKKQSEGLLVWEDFCWHGRHRIKISIPFKVERILRDPEAGADISFCMQVGKTVCQTFDLQYEEIYSPIPLMGGGEGTPCKYSAEKRRLKKDFEVVSSSEYIQQGGPFSKEGELLLLLTHHLLVSFEASKTEEAISWAHTYEIQVPTFWGLFSLLRCTTSDLEEISFGRILDCLANKAQTVEGRVSTCFFDEEGEFLVEVPGDAVTGEYEDKDRRCPNSQWTNFGLARNFPNACQAKLYYNRDRSTDCREFAGKNYDHRINWHPK